MSNWTIDRGVRLIAGAIVLCTAILAHYSNPNWIWFTVFVGFMLVQSTFTGFCPMEMILKALGVKESASCACDEETPKIKAKSA